MLPTQLRGHFCLGDTRGRYLSRCPLWARSCLRCVCTTEKTGRCPERPLSSSCPFDFALAAKVRNPPILLKNSDFGQISEIFPRTAHLQYFGEGFGKRTAPSPVASLWNRSRQSSLCIRKGVLFAEIFEIQLFEFFNKISPK